MSGTTLLKNGCELILRQDNRFYIINKNKCELADGAIETVEEQIFEIPKYIIKFNNYNYNEEQAENNKQRFYGLGVYYKIHIKNGIVHNDKAPAIKCIKDKKIISFFYIKNGLAHNDINYAYEAVGSDKQYNYFALNGERYNHIKDFYEAQKDTPYASRIFAKFFAKKSKY